MPDAFVPLATYLRPDPSPCDSSPEAALPEAALAEYSTAADGAAAAAAFGAFVAQIKRMRAALEDACAARSETFMRDLGATILGRELRLAPVELAAIVDDALAELRRDFPLRVRAHPDDLEGLHACELPTVADAELRRGDVTIDVRHGSIDASLGARFEALLDACGTT